MRLFAVSIVSLTLACAAAAGAGDDLLTATFAKMDDAAAHFKGLTADVKKVSHNEFLKEDDVDSGKMAVRRGRGRELQARIDITSPDPKQVGLNGRSVQMYFPKSNTEQILPMDKKTTTIVDQLLLLGFGSTSADLQGAYNVTLGGPDTIDGQKAVRLVLTPKRPENLGDVMNIELWISDVNGMAVQQKFNERSHDYVEAIYTNMKMAPNLPDSAVKLNVPKDAHKEYLH